MKQPRRLPTLLFVVSVIAATTGCADVSPPDVDNQQQRQLVDNEYEAIQADVQQRQSGVAGKLDEASSTVGDIGGGEFEIFDLDSLDN